MSDTAPETSTIATTVAAPAADDAPTLVLLPGMACDAELFRHQRGALQHPGRTVVADVHQRADTLPQMVALLLAEVPGPLLLAGCSLGGMLALEAWRQAPQRIRGLAIVGSSARADTPELIALRTSACALFAAGRMDEVLRANAVFAFDPAHAARLLPDYLAMMQRAGAERLIRQNQAVMARDDLRPVLPTITCPTLVVGGLSDQLTPPERAQEIAAAIPGAQLELLAACGHMVAWEQPEVLNLLLNGWLRRCAADR